MPLRDLFSKAPTPLAPTTEPWPRAPSSEESVPSSMLSSVRQSPLFSATTHPTLEEFLRTNYSMIPEFVAQVKRAKSLAKGGIGKEGEMTLSQPPVLNLEESSKRLNAFSASSAAKTSSSGDAKPGKALPSGGNKETQEEKKPASRTLPFSILAKEGSISEVIRPQVKSRPRIRAVMKGGTLVTLPVSRQKGQVSYKNTDLCDENTSTLPSSSGNQNSVAGVSANDKGSANDAGNPGKDPAHTDSVAVGSCQMAAEVKLAEAQEKVRNASSSQFIGKVFEKETTNNEDPSHFTRVQVQPGNPKERGEFKQGVNEGHPGQNENSHDIHSHAVDLVNKKSVFGKDVKSDDLNNAIAMGNSSNEEDFNMAASVKPLPGVSSKLEVKEVKVIGNLPHSSTNANKTTTVTAKQPVVKRKSRRVCLLGLKRSTSNTSNNVSQGNEPGSSIVRKEPECLPSLQHVRSGQKSISHLKDENALGNQTLGDHGVNGKFECVAMSRNETSLGCEIAGKLIEKEIGENVMRGTASQGDQKAPLGDSGKEMLSPKKNNEGKDLVNRRQSTKEGNMAVNKDFLNTTSPSESVSRGTNGAKAVDLDVGTSENAVVEPRGNAEMNNNKGLAKDRHQYPGGNPAGEHQIGSPIETSGAGIEEVSCQMLKEQLVENRGGHSNTESKGLWESEGAQPFATDRAEDILDHPVDKKLKSPSAQKMKNTSDKIAVKVSKALVATPNCEHDNGRSEEEDGVQEKHSVKREDSDTKENVLDDGNCQNSPGDGVHCGRDEHGEELDGTCRGTNNVMDVSKGEDNHSNGGTASAESDEESYAELIMRDSDSGEDSEDEVINSFVDKDSEEDDVDVKSDYKSEDMDLDSDPDSSTGGIVYWSAAKTRSQKNREAHLRRKERRKAKYQRKKASRQRAKAAKKALKEKNNSKPHSEAKGSKRPHNLEIHGHVKRTAGKDEVTRPAAASRPSPKTSGDQKKCSISCPLDEMKASQDKPRVENTSDESLLSLVSTCALDVTVAASEKLALKRSRGGQHAKKIKKAKRRAAAMERIKNGEPHPRPRRMHIETSKPLCKYYVEGKCRKGEECPFRHEKAARVKKKEMCKFYATGSCLEGNDCIFMHNSFPCKFFHTSRCWDSDHCKFSHDPLTEETKKLLQTVFYPPKDYTHVLQDDSSFTTGSEQAWKPSDETGKSLTPSTDIGEVSQRFDNNSSPKGNTTENSSPYNLRARKRRLSSEGSAENSSVVGGKASKQSRLGSDQQAGTTATEERQDAGFFPGLYKDLSV